MKSDERLAFEEDRLRLRFEFRMIQKRILNELEDELRTIHENANARGVIPEVRLESSDKRVIENGIRKVAGVLGYDEADR